MVRQWYTAATECCMRSRMDWHKYKRLPSGSFEGTGWWVFCTFMQLTTVAVLQRPGIGVKALTMTTASCRFVSSWGFLLHAIPVLIFSSHFLSPLYFLSNKVKCWKQFVVIFRKLLFCIQSSVTCKLVVRVMPDFPKGCRFDLCMCPEKVCRMKTLHP